MNATLHARLSQTWRQRHASLSTTVDTSARCRFPGHSERLFLTARLASRIRRRRAGHRRGVSGLDQPAAAIGESPAAD